MTAELSPADEILRLRAMLAAESAARRVAEARLDAVRTALNDNRTAALLRSLRAQMDEHLSELQSRPYDFKL